MALDPDTAQQQSKSAVSTGLKPTLTLAGLAAVLVAALAPVYATLKGMGTWDAQGAFVPRLPFGSSVLVVPTRVASGTSPAVALATDFLLVLNGPAEVDLEQSPPIGTTHVIKQASPGSLPVTVLAAAGDTVEGAQSMTFPPSALRPALTVSFSSLGWQAY